jgi:SWI/SNF-related matrix-associated actin-dependent regulator 1 of chromatin subfamily A
MIRRLRKEVGCDIPKIRNTINLDIDNRKDYQEAEEDFIAWLKQNATEDKVDKARKAESLTKMAALQHLSAIGKISSVIQWITDFLEEEKKLIVAGIHKDVLNTIFAKFKDIAVRIDGSVNAKNKQAAETAFQNDEKTRLLVCHIDTIIGLDLTRASDVAFAEIAWRTTQHEQCEDRVARLTQKESMVMMWYLIGEDTIEEKMVKILDKKGRDINATIDGGRAEEFSLSEMVIGKYLHKEA